VVRLSLLGFCFAARLGVCLRGGWYRGGELAFSIDGDWWGVGFQVLFYAWLS